MPKKKQPTKRTVKRKRHPPAPGSGGRGKGLALTSSRTGEDEYGARGGMPAVSTGIDRSLPRAPVTELTWPQFDRLAQELARTAARRSRPDAVVGLVHGGVFVGGAVASALGAEFFPVRLSRRSRDTGAPHPGLSTEIPADIKGRRVLLVDDVAGSGDSLELGRRLSLAAGAASVVTAALVARERGYAPDVAACVSDAFFVFPWDYPSLAGDLRFDPAPVPGPAAALGHAGRGRRARKSPTRSTATRG